MIVEGIERPQQLTQLLELGRPSVQGYLFSRPLAPEACLRVLSGETQLFGRPPAGLLAT